MDRKDDDPHKLQKLSSLRFRRNNSSINHQNSDHFGSAGDIQYTSLKDLTLPADCQFYGNNISISNKLVMQAASHYLRSTAILVNRVEENCFASLWSKLRNSETLRSYWRAYVRNPIRACFQPLLRLFPCMVAG